MYTKDQKHPPKNVLKGCKFKELEKGGEQQTHEVVRKDMMDCRVTENMDAERVEWKDRTYKVDQ